MIKCDWHTGAIYVCQNNSKQECYFGSLHSDVWCCMCKYHSETFVRRWLLCNAVRHARADCYRTLFIVITEWSIHMLLFSVLSLLSAICVIEFKCFFISKLNILQWSWSMNVIKREKVAEAGGQWRWGVLFIWDWMIFLLFFRLQVNSWSD